MKKLQCWQEEVSPGQLKDQDLAQEFPVLILMLQGKELGALLALQKSTQRINESFQKRLLQNIWD